MNTNEPFEDEKKSTHQQADAEKKNTDNLVEKDTSDKKTTEHPEPTKTIEASEPDMDSEKLDIADGVVEQKEKSVIEETKENPQKEVQESDEPTEKPMENSSEDVENVAKPDNKSNEQPEASKETTVVGGDTIMVEEFKEEPKIIRIRATILVERNTQKGIVIGHKGEPLKKLGTQARKDIERFFDKKVFLQLYVKVEKDWRNREIMLKKFGYKLDG